jgi:hypothetical protein
MAHMRRIALVMKDGKYLPLTAKVVAEERRKLD